MTRERAEQIRQMTGLKPGGATAQTPTQSPQDRVAAFRDRHKKTPVTASETQPQQEGGSFLGDVGQAFQKTGAGLKQAFEMAPGSVDQTQGGWLQNLKQTAEAGLQGVGSVAGGLNDIVSSAIHRSGADKALKAAMKIGPVGAIWDKLSPEDQKHVTEGISHLAGGAGEEYNAWKQQHPEAARNVENIWKIAQAVPTIEGGAAIGKAAPKLLTETLPEAAGKLTSAASEAVGAAKTGLEEQATGKALGKTIEATRPVLSKSEQIAARAAGRETPSSLFRPAEIAPEAKDIERAKALEGVYDPKKDLQTNINSIRDARAAEAKQTITDIKKNDSIFNKKQLNAHLARIEKPTMLASDPTMSKAYDIVKDKFMGFVDDQPKKLSGLLKARQSFDKWIDTQFPTLYTDERMTPLKQAIKDMRNAGNDYIESKLPEGSPFRSQLRKQHLMFEATENLAEQGQKTAGANKLAQWVKRHPVAATIGGGALGSLVGGETLHIGKSLTGM